ncbi:3' exoribonuclease family, domain 1 [Carpediemonas membranifera]|uniref:3' exoribonuclease family, domain 1 n=1 Tax=Carpediemonas membranifera TaxID=201153 RepID=A0A8J6BHA5_9EUKA|nr:3' exoribonuclease family, domain 1 [Carpediemonas membranifera]|eukprot:KAG9397452.1 3' exoribonuclease family, domain 1 [Carpediemonas membranifera]
MGVNNQVFITEALQSDPPLRVKHETLMSFRKVAFEFGNVGCCLVSLGDSRVSATVTATIGEPLQNQQNEGRILISVNDTARHATMAEKSLLENLLQAHLTRVITRLNAVNREALVIADNKVWILRVDTKILNNDGNLTDACTLAAVAALRHFRLPITDVTHHADGSQRVKVMPASSHDPRPLDMPGEPLSCSFMVMPTTPPTIVADPTAEEEETAACSPVTVLIDGAGRCCGLIKPGGPPIPPDTINALVKAADELTRPLCKRLSNEVAVDHQRRKVEMIRDARMRDT